MQNQIENPQTSIDMPKNGVHALLDLLKSTYICVDEERVDETTPAGACLRPLLASLEWAGEARHLQESLPHFDALNDIDGLRAVLARLNFETHQQRVHLDDLNSEMFPCLFIPKRGELCVVLSREANGTYLIFDGASQSFQEFMPAKTGGTIYLIRPHDVKTQQKKTMRYGWLQTLIIKFRRTFFILFGLTFVINVLALTVPIYVMNVYDKAIGSKSLMTLGFLTAAIAIVLGFEMLLRTIRSQAIAYLGTRIETLLSVTAFQQLLHLPLVMTENAPIGAQITRLKQFESIRDVFSGPLASTVLDLPFSLVFLGAIFVIGGVLGWIPVALIVIYLIMASITIPITRYHIDRAGEAKIQSRNFLIELTTKFRGIRNNTGAETWINRFSGVASSLIACQFKAQQTNFIVQTLAQVLAMIAGAATVGLGTLMVLNGELSMGALIAIMALIWRMLSPLQAALLSLNRLGQVIGSFRQINHFMRLKVERIPGQLPTFYRDFKGKISMHGISLRYSSKSEPALRGINLQINPGEVIAITGPSGAGKSTLLKVMTHLYQPQAGVVMIDDLDLRQIDVAELRHAIGYAPQKPVFFYGTIAQNLKLAHPTASEEEIINALKSIGVYDVVNSLEDGIDSRIQGARVEHFTSGFLQQLMLARAFVKDAKIYLLDEPGTNLDHAGDEALIRKINSLRGQSTVVMATHRPSHMWLADRVFVVVQGTIVGEGPPDEVVPALMNKSQKCALSKS